MKIYTDIDLLPNIQKYLGSIEESKLHYKAHGLKHPSAIYNSSFGKIESGVKDFFEVFDLLVKEGFESKQKDHMPEVLKAYRQFLYSLREHLDDCFHVVKTLVEPKPEFKEDRDQNRWLRTNVPLLVNDFFDRISEYKKYLDLSVNELKHNNGILGSITFYSSSTPDDHCVGYYVANVVDDCYEPVEKIHAKFRDMHTGFSLRRDLTYNLYNVYALAEELSILFKDKFGISFENLKPKVEFAPENRKHLFQKLMDMPRFHLPDEYLKPVPSISITKENSLKLEYPSMLSIKPNRLDRVVLTHSPDGHTRKYRVLYATNLEN